MKAKWNKQNWYRWNGNLWVNFHDYHHGNGDILTVVRFRENGPGFTRQMLGKYRTVKGAISALRRDDTYRDEEPSTWWEASRLLGLRQELSGVVG